MRSRQELSAGGVVYRRTESSAQVLICRTSTTHTWVIPKGLVDRGETNEQAAIREVREETGITARIVEPLDPPEHYIYTRNGVRIFKTVHYYLMEYVSGTEADHDHEMDDVSWLSFSAAIDMVTYDSARSVLERARRKVTQTKAAPE